MILARSSARNSPIPLRWIGFAPGSYEEVLDIIRWMRRYNRREARVGGIDYVARGEHEGQRLQRVMF